MAVEREHFSDAPELAPQGAIADFMVSWALQRADALVADFRRQGCRYTGGPIEPLLTQACDVAAILEDLCAKEIDVHEVLRCAKMIAREG